MDVYQKREERKNKPEEEKENQSKTNINWDIGTNVKPLLNPYKY